MSWDTAGPRASDNLSPKRFTNPSIPVSLYQRTLASAASFSLLALSSCVAKLLMSSNTAATSILLPAPFRYVANSVNAFSAAPSASSTPAAWAMAPEWNCCSMSCTRAQAVHGKVSGEGSWAAHHSHQQLLPGGEESRGCATPHRAPAVHRISNSQLITRYNGRMRQVMCYRSLPTPASLQVLHPHPICRPLTPLPLRHPPRGMPRPCHSPRTRPAALHRPPIALSTPLHITTLKPCPCHPP